jgi:hypothetical protein
MGSISRGPECHDAFRGQNLANNYDMYAPFSISGTAASTSQARNKELLVIGRTFRVDSRCHQLSLQPTHARLGEQH